MPVRNTIHIGDARITLVEELVMPTSARWMLPNHPEPFALLDQCRLWLEPHFLNERGHILQSMHTWLVEVDGMRIVVDTGIGNDKDREGGGFEGWHMRNGPYLEDLAEAGAPADQVNVVLNTHLHGDHAGWNTKWVDGAWAPTFENARYQLVEREYSYWSQLEEPPAIIEDSVRPVVEAGVVDLVAADHRVSDSVWLEPSHGHTPGHQSLVVDLPSGRFVLTGDAAYEREQIDRLIPPPITTDEYAAIKSLARLKAFEERDGARVLVAHDIEQWKTTLKSPDSYYE